jgi:hypothetical protein
MITTVDFFKEKMTWSTRQAPKLKSFSCEKAEQCLPLVHP